MDTPPTNHPEDATQQSPHAGHQKLNLLQRISKNLQDFNKTYSYIQLYSWDHPSAQGNIRQNLDVFKKTIAECGRFSIIIQDKKFMIEGNSIDMSNPGLARLGRRLSDLGLVSLTFSEELTFEDMEKLFRMITSTEHEIADAGGIDMLAQRENMLGIKINASYYKLVQENEEVVDANMIGGGGGGGTPDGLTDAGAKPREMIESIVADPASFCNNLVESVAHVNRSLSGVELSNMMNSLVRNVETATKQEGGAPILRAAPLRKKQVVRSYAQLEVNLKREAGRRKGTLMGKALQQMTEVVAEAASSARAEAVVSEFMETDGDQERTKEMLKAVSPKTKTDEEILAKVKERDQEHPGQIAGLPELVEGQINERKEKSRKRRKTGLLDRVRKQIAADFRIEPGIDQLMDYLERAVSNELQAALGKKMAAHAEELARKDRILSAFNHVFRELNMGLVIVGKDKTVEEAANAPAIPPFIKVGQPLLPEVTEALDNMNPGESIICENTLISNVCKTPDNQIAAFVVSPSPTKT